MPPRKANGIDRLENRERVPEEGPSAVLGVGLGYQEADFRAFGVDYFLLRLRHAHSGGPPHKSILNAIERFGRDVIPHLG